MTAMCESMDLRSGDHRGTRMFHELLADEFETAMYYISSRQDASSMASRTQLSSYQS